MSRLSALKKTNPKEKLESLKNRFENRNVNMTDKKRQPDTRFWKPTYNEKGEALAIIKFLPAVDKENAYDFVNQKRHVYRAENGQWYWHNCPTTIGKPCLRCKANWDIYNSSPEGKELWKNSPWKPQNHFIANIYVEKDITNPENSGKVFLYEFGGTIKGLIEKEINGSEGDAFNAAKAPCNPFGFEDTCILQFKVVRDNNSKQMSSYDYSACRFVPCEKWGESDEFLEKVLEQEYDLEQEFLAEDKFPTEEEQRESMARCHPELYSGSVSSSPTPTPEKTEVSVSDYNEPARKDEGESSVSLDDLRKLAMDDEDIPF